MTPALLSLAILAATPAEAPVDFVSELRLLSRVVACIGKEALPPALDPAVAAEHCRWLSEVIAPYRTSYLPRVSRFMAAHVPKDLPSTVVYPFGGGDLLTALSTYPEAREYITVSLEHSGDPRRGPGMDSGRWRASLAEMQRRVQGLFAHAESTSENMMQLEKGDLPGQLSFFLVALAAHGHEPVGLRYFRIEPSGELHYFTASEIAAEEGHRARKLREVWVSPDFASVFSNSELVFRRAGVPGAPLLVHRHIAADLSDAGLQKDPSVLRYLEQKGRVAEMTKAASYLLWTTEFSRVSQYLAGHMAFMISDSTGLPPAVATKAGLTMETYGRFEGPYLAARKSVAADYRKLWREQPPRDLDFRYGYPDASRSNHLVITRPAAPATPPPKSR